METSVKRINRLFALGAAFAVLASQACNSSSSTNGEGKFGANASNALAVVDGGVIATPVAGALAVTYSSPSALPATAFSVDVTFRNAAGATLDVSDVVTVTALNGTVAATLGGTTSVAAVHGVASFTNLSLATVGSAYTLTFTGSGSTVTAAALKSPVLKIGYTDDDAISVGGVANNSAATAQSISPNVPMIGTLGGGEVHYYKFAAKAGQIISVASYGNRLDLRNWDTSLRLKLVNTNGTTEMARSGAINANATGIDTGFAMIKIPATGTYYLVADQDQAGFASGKFGVLLTLLAPTGAIQTETEPAGTVGQNDTAATAQALVPGVMFGQYDNPSTNVSASDYYKIAISTPTRINLELVSARNGFANGQLLKWDGVVVLTDSAGNTLIQDDNSRDLDGYGTYVVTTAGTYYARVTRSEYATNTASAPYALIYTATPFAPLAAAAAASNTAATAVVTKYNQDVTGSFTSAGTQWFSFPGTIGDVVRLTTLDSSELQSATLAVSATPMTNTVTSSGRTTGTIGSPSGSAVAPGTGIVIGPSQPIAIQGQQAAIGVPVQPIGGGGGIVLVLPGLSAVLMASDGVTALPVAAASATPTETKLSTEQIILQATGTYYVKVSSVLAGKFGFRLDLVSATSREVEPNDTIATATAIGANGWSSGYLASATDVDYFSFRCEALQLCTVSLLAAAGNGMGTASSDWGSALIPVVEVRDASGNLITTTTADRKGLTNYAESNNRFDSHVETSFRATAGATYTVAVHDQDKQFGATFYYALHLWKNQ
jgi:hypothetical protein